MTTHFHRFRLKVTIKGPAEIARPQSAARLSVVSLVSTMLNGICQNDQSNYYNVLNDHYYHKLNSER